MDVIHVEAWRLSCVPPGRGKLELSCSGGHRPPAITMEPSGLQSTGNSRSPPGSKAWVPWSPPGSKARVPRSPPGSKARVPWSPSGSKARGYTLLELMIVLVILVTLLAVVWPNLRRPLGRGLLREAGQQLAQHVAEARILAIESGQTLALRFEPGGSHYAVLPAEATSNDEQDDLALETQEDPYAPWTGDEETDTAPAQIDGLLPNDIEFVDPLAEDSVDEALLPGLEDEFSETEAVTDPLGDGEIAGSVEDWSAPILFYPTGRAENAQFRLRSPDGYIMTITLRGLTGAVTLAKPERETPAGPRDATGEDVSEPEVPETDPALDFTGFE